MITVGVDIGTAAVKIVFAEKFRILWKKTLPSTYMNQSACVQLFEDGLRELSLNGKNVAAVAATGYGARLFKRADRTVSEITSNALGIWLLSGKKAGTVINIGGQDVKIIKISQEGRMTDFKMNDKCAAGTGRFFEMAERILDIPLSEFGKLGLLSGTPLEINSTCAVFAETELVSLISEGKNRNDIIAGLTLSIARRISMLAEGMDLEDGIYLDGGPALNTCLRVSLENELSKPVSVLEQPQFTVAFGAAALISETCK